MSKKFTVLMDRDGKILSGPREDGPQFFLSPSDGVAFIGESDLSEQRAIESAERARQRYLAQEPTP